MKLIRRQKLEALAVEDVPAPGRELRAPAEEECPNGKKASHAFKWIDTYAICAPAG